MDTVIFLLSIFWIAVGWIAMVKHKFWKLDTSNAFLVRDKYLCGWFNFSSPWLLLFRFGNTKASQIEFIRIK
ncbi:hypothetical protein AHMF7605_02735 [Adhaeribacter arboris]|uniref:Uncharacterized protein n=1 Tax=Adhaeribacter arboris TaxID=2072846 RepID=A0A2T2YAH2_9BACT|nr:hypothetical protein AHMF7605_02735 [Adhaeribacter arboris]